VLAKNKVWGALFKKLSESDGKKGSKLVLEDKDEESTWLFNLSGADDSKALKKTKSGVHWGTTKPALEAVS